ncbi:hypothetical protein OG535_37575 [Kitasatospora sp. NBC_00085]|uniref:hypothetical protein n=1 Tax=unclassified Kitasatospora TaxID=2633591 RepID=UPI00324C828F
MRKRLLGGLVVVAAASGCGGSAPAAAPSAAVTTQTQTQTQPQPSNSPLADCVTSITPWLQTYLDGGSDLGDYQEMGLSSAQGGALRDLQRQAAALRAQGPLPSGWVAPAVGQACASILAARAAVTSKPTGWP